jgi:hypothetical protein
MNAEIDETVSPEQVMALHNSGFRVAHAARVGRMRHTFAKQWDDDDRVRVQKGPRVPTGLEQPHRIKDRHLVERVIEERQQPDGAARRALPREAGAFERGPARIHFFGETWDCSARKFTL